MNEIESKLLEIADMLREQQPDTARQILASIEQLRVWREQESSRQAKKRMEYTKAMLAYVDSATTDFESDNAAWTQRERERIARIVATDKRWQGTYAALCELLA